MNKLAQEKSPYLLQHKNNPVDWYPWGEEAFAKARQEDKLIFLSIGYSTCHWCHVMEHESFENPGVAKILNELYVAIKVDREERPDIDAVYMKAVMALTGQGGWPLSAFLTPDRKPFYGGTYFPPDDRWGRPGFVSVLTQLHSKWINQRDIILNAGNQLTESLNDSTVRTPGVRELAPLGCGEVAHRWLTQAQENLANQFDPENGGFGHAPKFPRTHVLDFLLRKSSEPRTTGHEPRAQALNMVEKTLRAMAAGGIHDHLGGGFHRYSVDQEWFVPHFEKMLYDQALIGMTYLKIYAQTKNPFYADTARSIFEYVLRDLTSPEGGFFSAEDADSAPQARVIRDSGDVICERNHEPQTTNHDKREGAYYVWEEKEVHETLNADEVTLFFKYYELRAVRLEQDPHQEMTGKSILICRMDSESRTTNHEARALLQKLFKYRQQRARPHRDEKILTDWNALMIATLASAGRILNEPRLTDAAEKAAQFIFKNLFNPSTPLGCTLSVHPRGVLGSEARLLHRYAGGEAAVPAFLEDYAFLAIAMAELYQTTFKIEYLQQAYFLNEEMLRLFYDDDKGGFWLSANDGEKLVAQSKEIYDGAIPSGNGMVVCSLIRLGTVFGREDMLKAAEKTVRFFAPMIDRDPSAFPLTLMGLNHLNQREVFITGDPKNAETKAMLALRQEMALDTFWILKPQVSEAASWLDEVLPAARERNSKNGAPAAFVCQNQQCLAPVFSASDLKKLLLSEPDDSNRKN